MINLVAQIRQVQKQRSSPSRLFAKMAEPEHSRATYNDIHDLIKASAEKIVEFKPNMIIAIGVLSSFGVYEILSLRQQVEG
jgi:hypothetical protein